MNHYPARQPQRRRNNFNWNSAAQNALTTAATLAPINPWLAIPGALVGGYLGGKSGPHQPSAGDYQPFRNAWDTYHRGAMQDLRQGVDYIGNQSSQRVAGQGLYDSPLGQSLIQNNQNWALNSGLSDINRNRYQFEQSLAQQQFGDQRAYDQQMQNQWIGTLQNLAFNALPIYNQYFRPDPTEVAQQKLLGQRFDNLAQTPAPPTPQTPAALLPGADMATGLAMMGVQPPQIGTVESAPGVTMAGPNAPPPQYQGPPANGGSDYWTQGGAAQQFLTPSGGQQGTQQQGGGEGSSDEEPITPEVAATAEAIQNSATASPELKEITAIDPGLAVEITQAFGDVFSFESANQYTMQGGVPQGEPFRPSGGPLIPEGQPHIVDQTVPPTATPKPWDILPPKTLPPSAVPQPWAYVPQANETTPQWGMGYLMQQTPETLQGMRESIHALLGQQFDAQGQGMDMQNRERLQTQLAMINRVSDRLRRQAERRSKTTATALGGLEQLDDRTVEATARPSPTPVVNPFIPAEPGSAYTGDMATDLIQFGEGPMLRHAKADPTSGYNIGWGRSITHNGMDIQSELIPMLRQSYPNDFQIQEKLRAVSLNLNSQGRVQMTPMQFKRLFPFGISETQARTLLQNDIRQSQQSVINAIGGGVYFGLDAERQSVLIDMMHTLGERKFKGFVNMINALQRGNYYQAAAEMRNSLWYSQVKPRRANPLIRKMIGSDQYQQR